MRIIHFAVFLFLFFIFLTPTISVAQSSQDLAVCLTSNGWKMYGTAQCPNCKLQKEYFGDSFTSITYIECGQDVQLCQDKKIRGYPTWEDKQGNLYRGAIPLDVLAKLSGCVQKEQSTPATQSTFLAFSQNINFMQLLLAFMAGLLSFFAPCCLPLFPAYFSVISGYTFAELYGLEFGKIRARVFLSSLFFVAGFTVIFIFLGAVSSVVGKFLEAYLPWLLKLSGVFIIGLGFVQIGIIKIHALEYDYAWNIQRRLSHLGFLTAGITGVAVSLSWIPCIGPLLSPILIMASRSSTALRGSVLLSFYSLGLTTPFLLGGLFFPLVVRIGKQYRLFFHRLSQLAGIFLIAFGILLLLGTYQTYQNMFSVSKVNPYLARVSAYVRRVIPWTGSFLNALDYLLKFSK